MKNIYLFYTNIITTLSITKESHNRNGSLLKEIDTEIKGFDEAFDMTRKISVEEDATFRFFVKKMGKEEKNPEDDCFTMAAIFKTKNLKKLENFKDKTRLMSHRIP